MEIIGLSGFARVGKDEVANILVNQYGFQRVAFADKLREVLYALNPMVGVEGEPYEGGLTYVGVKDVIDRHGWDNYKETEFGPVIRLYLQRLGTEAGRDVVDQDIWVNAAFNNLEEDARIVVTDARFNNEFEGVRSRGGELWRIERPGVGPLNDHRSEIEAIDYPHFTLTIDNDGTLEDLSEKIRIAYLGD